MKKCIIDAISTMEENEDTFLKCLYIANFLNYPAMLQRYMENLVQDWELVERKIDWKRRIKTWMWLALGVIAATGINLVIQLLPF
jgi:hypothetical protein